MAEGPRFGGVAPVALGPLCGREKSFPGVAGTSQREREWPGPVPFILCSVQYCRYGTPLCIANWWLELGALPDVIGSSLQKRGHQPCVYGSWGGMSGAHGSSKRK